MTDPKRGGAMTPPAASATVAAPNEEPPLDWSVNPWRERTRAAVAATISAVLTGVLVVTAQIPPLAALALTIAVVATMAPGFAVSRCRVDDQGVARQLGGLWWDRRPWDRIRLAQWVRSGLLVSPERRPGTWAALRGLFLPLPLGEQSNVLREELHRRMVRHGL